MGIIVEKSRIKYTRLTASLPVFTNANKELTNKSASEAFEAIKQAASATASGVVELATSAEVLTGTDTERAITPASRGLKPARVYKTADATLTAAQMQGQTIVVTGGAAVTLTLPAVAAGLNAVIISTAAQTVNVKAGASDKITLHGTALDDGDKVSSDGEIASFIEILANAAGTDWETGLFAGAWTDGGA